MTVCSTPIPIGDGIELVRCSNLSCEYEYVRPITSRKHTPLCIKCHSEMVLRAAHLVLDDEPTMFDLGEMRRCLEVALGRCEELRDATLPPPYSRARLRREGRAEAYLEVLAMLDAVIASGAEGHDA